MSSNVLKFVISLSYHCQSTLCVLLSPKSFLFSEKQYLPLYGRSASYNYPRPIPRLYWRTYPGPRLTAGGLLFSSVPWSDLLELSWSCALCRTFVSCGYFSKTLVPEAFSWYRCSFTSLSYHHRPKLATEREEAQTYKRPRHTDLRPLAATHARAGRRISGSPVIGHRASASPLWSGSAISLASPSLAAVCKYYRGPWPSSSVPSRIITYRTHGPFLAESPKKTLYTLVRWSSNLNAKDCCLIACEWPRI